MTKKKTKRGPAPGTLYRDIKRTPIGTNLIALRREKGLSQQDLADKAGLSKRMISYYERESETIPINQLEKIAKVLNVTIDDLIKGKPRVINLQTSKSFLKKLEIAKKLPPDKQKIIGDLIDSFSSQSS